MAGKPSLSPACTCYCMLNPVRFALGLTPAGACGLMTQAAHSRQIGWPFRSSAS